MKEYKVVIKGEDDEGNVVSDSLYDSKFLEDEHKEWKMEDVIP